ncbi:MAG: ATP-NAD kinase family protein [Hyphomicrobiaceae bacterium]
MRIGFLVNPIAGMGGRVGLKGTDDVVDEARRLGAEPIAQDRATQTLQALRKSLATDAACAQIMWMTLSGEMGEVELHKAGFEDIEIIAETSDPPTRQDTERAVQAFLVSGVDLILFCGGDGTARDITQIIGDRAPVLGIPSGVKMYSGVFGVSPIRTAEIVARFANGELTTAEVDILDLDEEEYRRGEWAVRLVGSATTIYEPNYTQAAKAFITESDDGEVKASIADYLAEETNAHPETLYLLGPGSTVQAVSVKLGFDTTLLGIDAIRDCEVVGRDLNEQELMRLLSPPTTGHLIVSPIGAQGFVLGRGNLQISPQVVRRIGIDQITVVATPAKIRRTPKLRFDTGDPDLDRALSARRYFPVITGYRRKRLVPIAT